MGLPINSYLHALRQSVKADKSLAVVLLGIGNPEPQYRGTRHNAGILIVQRLSKLFGGLVNESNTSTCKYGPSVCCDRIYFAESKEFMNTSGKAVKEIQKRIPESQIIIVHDDMELAPGEIKFKLESTSFGGHNGLRDIAKYGAFPRMRVGIGPPPAMDSKSVSRYVLGKMPIVQTGFLETKGTDAAYGMAEQMAKVYNKKFEGVPNALD